MKLKKNVKLVTFKLIQRIFLEQCNSNNSLSKIQVGPKN